MCALRVLTQTLNLINEFKSEVDRQVSMLLEDDRNHYQTCKQMIRGRVQSVFVMNDGFLYTIFFPSMNGNHACSVVTTHLYLPRKPQNQLPSDPIRSAASWLK